MDINFILNDRKMCVDSAVNSTVLKFLRDDLKLSGTKEGCGEGECGACTVLLGTLSEDESTVEYRAVPACLLPVTDLNGRHLVTIEGVSQKELSPVQQIFVDEGATQCGFCTPGFMMSITAWFLSGFREDQNILDAMDGHICRCTGYNSIKKALTRIEKLLDTKHYGYSARINGLIAQGIVPPCFAGSLQQLVDLNKGMEKEPLTEQLKDLNKRGIIAGGTDILVQNNGRILDNNPVFLSNISELSGISEENGFIRIMAGTLVEALKQSPVLNGHFPGFDGFLTLVSSKLIRNRATVAGNIVNASPIGDISILFIALRAELILMNGNGDKRRLKITDFFKGYKKIDLKEGEIVYEIRIPVPEGGYRFNFEKVSQRKYLDIAACNSAMLMKIENGVIADCTISAGGVFAYPLSLEKLSGFLTGKRAAGESIAAGEDILNSSIRPISDIRGSETYKRILMKNLLIAHMNVLGDVK